MKRVVAAAAVCVLVFCGCQGGELDETMLTYTNELSKVNEIDVIPDDAPDIVETLSGEEELERVCLVAGGREIRHIFIERNCNCRGFDVRGRRHGTSGCELYW